MATKQDLKAKALKELEEEQKRLLEQERKKKAAEQAKANKEADLIGAKDAAKLNNKKSLEQKSQTTLNQSRDKTNGRTTANYNAGLQKKAEETAKQKEKDLPGFDGYAYQRAKQQQIEKEKTEYLNTKEARDKKSALEKELAGLRNRAKEESKKAGTVAIVASGRKGGAGSVVSAETESEIDRLEKEIIDLDKSINLADRAQNKKYLKDSALKAEDFEDYSYDIEEPEKRYYKSPVQKRETETVKGYMNEEERKIYNYYYNKFGEEKAEEYFESIRGDLNMREAVAIFMGNEGKTANEYLMGAAAGLDQAKSGYQSAMRMLFGDEKTDPTSVYQYLSGMAREDLADKGPKLPEALGGASLGQIGFDAVNTGANMLPSLMLGTLGGGAIGAAAIGTSAAGNAYSEALSAGYGKEQATNYAALVGASEAALGYLLGGIEAQGGKLSKAALSKVLPKIDGALAKASVALPAKMLSEFSEEYLQEVLSPVFENIAFEEENKIDLLSPEAIYSGIMGALTAGASAVADGSAFGGNIAADIPVPFDGKAQPGTEAGLVAEKIAEIEKSSLTESEKAEKMAKIAEAVAETTASEDVIAEVEKFRNLHRQKELDRATEVANRLGNVVEFDDKISANGIHKDDGTIIINPNSKNPVMQILIHELTHDIETSGLYEGFSKKILDYAAEVRNVNLAKMEQEVINDYAKAGQKLDRNLADREIVAKFAEEYLFTDEKAIDRLCDTDPTVFRRIKYWIEDMIAKLRGTPEERFFIEAQRLYEKALASREQISSIESKAKSVGRSFDKMAMDSSEIQTIQNIGKISVNNFTSQDIKNTEKFAKKYLQEIGTKSPFFKSWFGDWRENDQTPVQIADKIGDARKTIKNNDTGWDIQVSGKVFDETLIQRGKKSVNARPYLQYINDITKKAVLLDSFGIEPNRKKSPNSLLMHSMYAVADIGNGPEILKLYVEEMYDPNKLDTTKRDYKLIDIQNNSMSVTGSRNSVSPSTQAVVVNTVADLFDAVKRYDPDFQPKPSSKVVNPDGTPKVVYHGTFSDFWTFDINKSSDINNLGKGFYFSSDYDDSKNNYANKEGADILSRVEGLAYDYFFEMGHSEEDLYDNEFVADYNKAYEMAEAEFSEDKSRVLGVYLDIKNPVYVVAGGVTGSHYEDVNGNILNIDINDAQKLGFDGIIDETVSQKFPGAGLNTDSTHYVVFEPTQIKSATDNIGTFDPQNPDIRYSTGRGFDELAEEAAYNEMQEMEDSVPSFVRADIDRIANDPSIDSEQKVFDLMKLFDNAKSPAEKAEIGRYIYKFKTEPEKATEPVIAENEAADISAEVVASAKRVAERVYQRRQEEKATAKQAKAEENQSSTSQVNPEENESKAADVPQSEKSKRIERRYQRAVEDGVASVFGVSRKDLKGDIRPILDEIAADVKDGKKISDEQINRLYKQAFDDGIITEEFPQYDSTRKYIRETPIYVDKKTRDEFGDDREFLDFARSNIGNFKITTDPRARHLDSFYDELSKEAPDWFSEDEIDPKTQLEDIADFMDKTKKQYMGLSERYHGSELADFEIWAKKELHAFMEEYGKGLETVERYERDRQIRADHKAKEMNGDASFEAAKKAFENRKVFNARKAMEDAKANALLNDNDLWLVKRLHEGTISEGDVFEGAQNREGVLEVYRAEKAYKEAIAPFVRYSVSFKQSVQHDAIEAIKYSDDFNDKGGKLGGLRYQRETAERNILDITDGGKSGGKAIIENYIEPVHEHEAMATRFIKEMNQRVKDLELGHLNRYERAYTQMIGENSVYLSEGRITKHNKKEHEALNEKILELLEAYGDKIDKEKCEKAAAGFMAIYEDLLERWNNERIRLGQEPVGNIEAYFPHFELAKPETKLQKFFAEKLGMEIGNSKLPTEIVGRTAGRKPKSKYNPHAKRRLGDLTDYDVLKGFDGYLRTVAHNIYHTEDIIKLRALSDSIRAKYSDESISDKIKAIINREDLSETDRANLIAEAIEKVPDKFHLSNFVAWLDDYTNIIAGKKSYGDREMEFALGREMYDISRALEGRIASNMIGWNASTPAMNLVPLFQATADLSPAEIISSLAQTAVSALKHDSYISDNSDFLTNRFGYETLYKQNYNLFSAENMAERVSKMQDGGAFAMELIDRIVSESLVRGRLQHNLKKGLTTEEAFSEADQWAAGLIADRSLGALPTVFEKKNPVMKALTMFQIEGNNQWSYIFKDAGKYKWEKEGAINTITGQLVFWAAMAICNALSDELLGKEDAVPDPIGITADAIEKLQKGEQVGNVLFDTATSIVKQMPVIGSYLGGGRISLSAAAPDFENLSKLLNDNVSGAKKGEIILTGLLKPLSYILAPTGAGQAFKTGQAAWNMIQGGAYGTEADGDRYMKFAQEYDPESIVKNLLFGPYAAYAGQNYIDSGFKDKLSAEQTKQMEIAHKEYGIPKDVFYETVLGLKPYKKEEEKREALFNNPDITASQKDIIDYLLFGKPTTKAIENDVVAPERVYTSEEGFYRSGLSDADKRLFDAGYAEKEIEAIDKGYDRGRNKGEKIDNIQNALGCSKAEAFEIYSRRTGKWIDELPGEEEIRAEGARKLYGMSAENYLAVLNLSGFGVQKGEEFSTKAEDVIPNIAETLGIDRKLAEEYYNRVVSFDYSREDIEEEEIGRLDIMGERYDVDDRGYFIAKNAAKIAEGKKDEYGNTVSGSVKAEAVENIANQLHISKEEAMIYYLAAEGDLVLTKEDLSSSHREDLEAAKKHGWTERQFLDAVNVLKLSGASKKNDIIKALMDAGASYEMAQGYYNLREDKDYNRYVGETTVSYGLSTQKQADKVDFFVVNYGTEDVSASEVAKWIKAAKGKRKKNDIIGAYQSAGASYSDAVKLYSLMQGRDKEFNTWYEENGG
ncbi:MAG: hypothetical protein IKL57_01145 [Oscillospiraceae bacterium]|nr:hypothetical protein [Oscillospiraceae bacterium]